MHKIIKLLTAITLLLTGTVYGQDNSLLWRISGNNLAKPSYLFGTIHLICPADYVWTERMEASLSSSERVCFEMDLSDPDIMMQVITGMTDKTGKKLSDYFTPAQYKIAARYVKDSMHLDIAMFEKMKPVMLETFLSAGNINCANPVSYEDSIMKTAQAAGKKILGLEDPAEQIKALETIPVDSVIASLMDDIQNGNKADTEYEKMVAAYKLQDLPALYAMINNSPGMENEKGPLLDDRNKKWVTRIMDKTAVASVFFAVGAGHLYGPQGVIALLRKKGYTIEPIK